MAKKVYEKALKLTKKDKECDEDDITELKEKLKKELNESLQYVINFGLQVKKKYKMEELAWP